ncbi:13502_t:CDS:2, partial [Cetraspora pellucida]
IPTSILSLAQNRNRSLTFTAVISPEDSQVLPGIVLTPHLTLNSDFVSMFLIAFTVIQTVTAAYDVLFSNSWILKILNGSLQKAYNLDPDLIKEFEYELSCNEYSIIDRSSEFVDNCHNIILMNRF